MLKFGTTKKPHIHLFGAGGTGGFALEFMTRLFAGQDATIEIYDGDTVEPKNLKRQNFVKDDIDKTKVEALIDRLSNQVLEPPTFIPHTEFIVDVDDIDGDEPDDVINSDDFIANILMTTEEDEDLYFISAVDNISTRRLLNKIASELGESDVKIVQIDSGNNDQGGQVVLYANYDVNDEEFLKESTTVTLPSMLELYPEIDVIKDHQDENPGIVRTCADEAESKPQAMMANVRNGELIASIVYQLSQNNSFAHNVWQSDIISNATTGYRKGV